MPEGSPPALGSEIAIADFAVPAAYGSRYFFFCSGVPTANSMCILGESGGNTKGVTVRPSSSFSAIHVVADRLAPPSSSGASKAHSPNSLHFFNNGASSSGSNLSCSPLISRASTAASSGISSWSTNFATRSMIMRASSACSAVLCSWLTLLSLCDKYYLS